jgi:hypothetical protein
MTSVALGLAKPSIILIGIITMMLCACGRSVMRSSPSEVVDPVARLDSDHLEWLRFSPENVSRARLESLPPEILADPDRACLATGFSLERPQFLDVGIYGKIGTATAFVARRSKIADYDRLYWVMVRVLSEKYGCFIRKKTNLGQTVRFECRDQRMVVLDRDISGGFAKFSGRQFDQMGREIIVKPRPVARR